MRTSRQLRARVYRNSASAMPKPRNAKTGAAVEIVEIGDPTLANTAVELIDQDVVQLDHTPLRARQIIVRLEDVIVVYYSTNLRLRSRPCLHDELLGYVTFGPGVAATVDGVSVGPDSMLAVAPATEIGFVTNAGYESVTFLVPPAELDAHLRARGRAEDFRVPHAMEPLHVGAGLAGGLFRWGKRLVDIVERHPTLFDAGNERRLAAKVDLIEALLATLAASSHLEPERRDRSQRVQSRIVRAAERYALAHTAERLYVTDLCRAAGVSERTLEYAFKAVMQLSPVAYLTRLRLHRVRAALQMAAPGSTTVTAEALRWGFWHFGEFSRAYKSCFGESPSDTLRRKPESPGPRT
ncbi:MAG TPA: helix-turn-helix domain-containing protein [Candidatus Binatia bacterium]|nr:helix-turn-helix domain-containing protein [Candidatus Binatia bacterium]